MPTAMMVPMGPQGSTSSYSIQLLKLKLATYMGWPRSYHPWARHLRRHIINQYKLLTELGVSRERLRKLNMKLHAHAIHSMHRLIKSRRLKEGEFQHRHVHWKKRPPDK